VRVPPARRGLPATALARHERRTDEEAPRRARAGGTRQRRGLSAALQLCTDSLTRRRRHRHAQLHTARKDGDRGKRRVSRRAAQAAGRGCAADPRPVGPFAAGSVDPVAAGRARPSGEGGAARAAAAAHDTRGGGLCDAVGARRRVGGAGRCALARRGGAERRGGSCKGGRSLALPTHSRPSSETSHG